jgi:predicted lipoprotein with Yx(FWY)xxD motif
MTANSTTKGAYLADPSGRTLYTYDKDTSGVSNCTGACLAAWPAYSASGAQTGLPAGISVITRSDGSMQYAYNGKPLYYYAQDSGPNVINGDGVGGVWHIVKM